MSPARAHFTRNDIGQLCERMEARGTSRLLRDRPELGKDLLCAAALLRHALDNGFPVTGVDVEVDNGWAG
jgi:hypothetical protein